MLFWDAHVPQDERCSYETSIPGAPSKIVHQRSGTVIIATSQSHDAFQDSSPDAGEQGSAHCSPFFI